MIQKLTFIVSVLAILFIGNALLGSDRLWNYMDYTAISDHTSMDSAREITVCMPTEMTVKGTHNVVKLNKGDKVRLLARYQKYLVPIVRSGDYLPTFNFVVMLQDSTICMGKLPEALIGATAVVRNNSTSQELEITKLKAAKNVSYEHGGEKKTSKYDFWVELSDGSRMAFEQLTWKRIGFTTYNARGRWELSDTAQSPKIRIDVEEMTAERYKADDASANTVGSRPIGYYKPRFAITDSSHFKPWAAKGVAGVVEVLPLIIFLLYLPIIIHKTIYRLPGKNWWIIFLSWVSMIVVAYFLSSYVVTSLFNHIFFFITILSVLHVKRDVEGCRCKYCGGLDCLKQIAGTPKKTYTWWGGWRKSQEEIGEIIETETRYGQTVSKIRHSVFKNIEQREHYKETTWGEAYYCKKCGMSYEYLRKDVSSTTYTRDLESNQDAMNREKERLRM